ARAHTRRRAATSVGARAQASMTAADVRAFVPWVLLCVVVFVWGLAPTKAWLNHLFAPQLHVAGLDGLVQRVPPVVAAPQNEPAVFSFNVLSATGPAILVAAVLGGLFLGYTAKGLVRAYVATLGIVWRSLVTISAMLAIGYVTRYSGLDAI